MQRQFDSFVSLPPDVLAVHWGWVIALGILIGALGILAIVRARIATIVTVGFFGALLLVSAVSVLIFAFSAAGLWTDFFVHVLWAVLLAIVGVILLTRPVIGAEAITLLIGFYFLVEGVMIIGFAFSSHIDGLWMYFLQGGVALLLGALLLTGWPFTGMWAIGTFLGIDLLFKGWGIIALGFALRAISEGSLL
ncbi:MAG: HdeD family acid-resistance protein [Methylocystis sp.]|uniref:HdeD family acid-resistance protein n=1 Tax=Methylocystis sp. TaxID=1911079 RepID=UPI003D0CE998